MVSAGSIFSWARSLATAPAAYPHLEEGQVLYVIGDIHGRSDCLLRAHAAIDRDRTDRHPGDASTEIYLGDYVDRGPDSKGVIDALLKRKTTASTVFLRGNHEILMQKFLHGHYRLKTWKTYGGLETLDSYDLSPRELLAGDLDRSSLIAERLPAEHVRFLDDLRDYFVFDKYCFVHAGLRPGVALDHQTIDDLAWIREEFLSYRGRHGYTVVHGHTPVAAVDFKPNRINIDTGAYLTNRLSVLKIDAAGPTVLDPQPTQRQA